MILAYFAGIIILFKPLVDWFYYPERKISTPAVFAIVLSFDVAWLVLMFFSLKKHPQIKLILTLIVFTLSVIILSCFVFADALKGAFN